jgi:hypothetical protein
MCNSQHHIQRERGEVEREREKERERECNWFQGLGTFHVLPM